MKKRLLGILLSFALMMGMMPALGVSQTAYADDKVTYLDKDGETKTVTVNEFITSGTTALTEGWYAVNENVGLASLSLTGNVNIILCDNKKLTVSNTSGDGITNSGVLTIYAQSKGSAMGKLDVTGNNGIENGKDLEVVGGDVKATGNAADGFAIRAHRDVKISGGSVTASGATAIFASRNVEIYGGTVTATATGDNGNAISASHYVDLMGGSVTASGAGCGIYVNNVQLGGSVRVWAGSSASDAADVTATFANNHGQKWVQTETATLWVGGFPVTSRNAENILGDAGATASYDYSTETLKLNNYSYEIEGHRFGALNNFYAAIYADQDLTIRLVGKNTVKCTEKEKSVGFGIYSNGKAITISGSGTLIAAGYGQSGIGIQTDNADITINGGTVTASGDNGLSANGGSVVINDGIVTAIGSSNDLGISADSIVVADKMGINAGDSKETAVGVDKKTFIEKHPQHWVQISEAYPLWVRGVWVMVTNRDDVLGDGKVSYDPKTNTLKLNGADIKADKDHQHGYAAICCEDKENELIIDAAKSGSVKGPDYDDQHEDGSYGIFSEGPLSVRGKLKANGGDAYDSCGIAAPALTVEKNAELTAGGDTGVSTEGGKIAVKGKLTSIGKETGIFIYGGEITVGSGAEMNVTGNKVAGIGSAGTSTVVINKGAKVLAVGGVNGAIDAVVKNAIRGTAWTDKSGAKGRTKIEIDTDGKELGEKYKRVQFPAAEYTITYDLNGGTLDGMTGTVTWTVDEGDVIILPAPVREGYTFDYWEGSKYNAGDKYTVTGDHTFTAVWKAANNGGGKKGGTKTGDGNALGAWVALLLAAASGTAGMVFARKKEAGK